MIVIPCCQVVLINKDPAVIQNAAAQWQWQEIA